ncbi:hypothetical protein [Micromonospora antibiotica]|uniref:DUF4129 domain-containing protein n=1 Tax=Micromonospora antibiotica TaxID=2807623 RepID=A0ABS3VEL5_9ACTN|nr:hypothetical protein [Micromonospora antibiotica]MBO4164076.1 hypothetical protein [Micromonospora antibiotica]
MTDNLVRHHDSGNGRRYPSVQCPPLLTLGATRFAEPVATPEPYRPDQLSHTESARLVQAKADAEEALTAYHQRLKTAGDRMVDAWHRAKLGLHRLEVLLAERELGAAARQERLVESDHAADGVEDRRYRPGWQHPAFVWTVILLSAVYDTVFLAESFRDALDSGGSVEYWVAFLPGAGIFMALTLAGYWLGVPLFRHRARAERRRWRGQLGWRILLRRVFVMWRPEDEERQPGELPWPSWVLPVGFATLVVGVLALWAKLRGSHLDPHQSDLKWPLVGLLVLLSVSAIAFKAGAHNPAADRAKRVGLRRRAVTRRYDRLKARSEKQLAEHEKAWQELHLAVEDAVTGVWRHVTDAWTEIAEGRARHGLTGMVAPGFVTSADTDASTRALFAGLAGPSLRLETLRVTQDLLDRHRPEMLSAEQTALTEQLNAQLDAATVDPWPDPTDGGPATGQH